MTEPLLRVDNLKVHFPTRDFQGMGGLLPRTRYVKAVDGVSLELAAGESLGVVGESGCGKSTLARGILGLVPTSGGEVYWENRPITGLSAKAFRPLRRDMQVIFQDPLASLDPRMTIGSIIAEPLGVFEPEIGRDERQRRIREIMEQVGLSGALINRYPHEFSGGQCQRVGIARALVVRPRLLVCDEPVSALDVSIQAQIINLLNDLREQFKLSMIFISHDLSVVRLVSQRVLVLYLGRAMELADRSQLYEAPHHPYTRALLAALPEPDPSRTLQTLGSGLGRDLPSPLAPPPGCVFNTRCPHAQAQCRESIPALEAAGDGGHVACHYWKQLEQAIVAG